MHHREIDAAGNEANLVRVVVQFLRQFVVGRIRNSYARSKRYGSEFAAAVPVQVQGALGVVRILGHHDAVFHRNVQVGEHMALGQRGEQELFRIPPVLVPVEGGVGGAGEIRKSGRGDDVVTSVAPV